MSTGEPLVSAPPVPNQQSHNGQVYPLVQACASDQTSLRETVEWIAAHRDALLDRLERHGAILFRDFPLDSAEDLDQFIAAFNLPNFPYKESLSNAVRVNFTERVFSANEAPPEVIIYFHHEMAQTPIYPSKLFFFCLQPAEEGGATPLCRSDVLFERIEQELPEFADRCERLGLRYTNVMPAADDAKSGMGRSWQSTFGADSREAVELRLRGLDYSWQWLDDGCLRATTPVLPAVREISPGRKVFFNQLIAAFRGWKDERNDPSQAIQFGDGQSLDRQHVLRVAEMADELAFDVPWQKGDVALVDNFVVMHGRRSFRGTRKVLASLVAHTPD